MVDGDADDDNSASVPPRLWGQLRQQQGLLAPAHHDAGTEAHHGAAQNTR